MTSDPGSIVHVALPAAKQITLRLLIVIAVYAAVIYAGQRRWLRPKELLWVGGAMIFWAAAFLFGVIVGIVHAQYRTPATVVAISAALVVPLVLAMAWGLRVLMKRISAAR